MKLVRYGRSGKEKPGLIDSAGKLRDLSEVVADIDADTVGPRALARLARIKPETLPAVRGTPRLGPCVAKVGNFIAVGLNYADHAAESGQAVPKEPVLFNKAPSCVAGPNDDIVIPKGSNKTDWEVELAVVIGKRASYVAEAEAMDYVAGYCLHNDVSEREFQIERSGTWDKGKGCDTFAPLGPWLATPDEMGNIHQVRLWLTVNGRMMQDGTTANLIFNIPYLIAYTSQFMTLLPGDVISTGTPAGVGLGMKPNVYLKPGDVVELGIDRLGTARQNVKAYGSV